MAERRESRWEPDEDICAGCGLRTPALRLACADCGCIRQDRSGTFYLAPRLKRLLAYVIDGIVIVLIFVVASFAFTADDLGTVAEQEQAPTNEQIQDAVSLSDLESLIVQLIVAGASGLIWAFTGRSGQSPGMKLVRVHVRRTGGALPSRGRLVLRDLWPAVIAVLVGLVGWVGGSEISAAFGWLIPATIVVQLVSAAWVLWGRDWRALHDMAFDTIVVEMRQRPFSRGLA